MKHWATSPGGIGQLTSTDGSVKLTPASGKGHVVDLSVQAGAPPVVAIPNPPTGGKVYRILVVGPGQWWLGGNNIVTTAGTAHLVYTGDGGNTWTVFANSGRSQQNEVVDIAVNGQQVLTCDGSGTFYYSTNGGTTWTLASVAGYTVLILSATNWLACSGSEINQSTNQGASWTGVLAAGLGGFTYLRTNASGSPVWLAGVNGAGHPQVWFSTNGGSAWTNGGVVTIGGGTIGYQGATGVGSVALPFPLAVSPGGLPYLALNVSNVVGTYYTSNNGTAWTELGATTGGTGTSNWAYGMRFNAGGSRLLVSKWNATFAFTPYPFATFKAITTAAVFTTGAYDEASDDNLGLWLFGGNPSSGSPLRAYQAA